VRVLLDENLPVDLARLLSGHAVDTVSGLGWSSIKNGELLRRMTGSFDALVTMDRNLEFQQSIERHAFGIVVVGAASSRMLRIEPLIPQILAALEQIRPGELRTVGR
jgi:hypothetical protein